MNPLPSSPIPEVYVLWHPRCLLGEFLARKIHGWLRPGNGLGPEVFYRCLPAPEAPPGGLPPPLPGESRGLTPQTPASRISNLQIVLPLIDDNMIADATWRHWLMQLTQPTNSPEPREFLPVALDSTAFNAADGIRDKNFLRPAGLSAGAAAETVDKNVVARSLLKQLTEVLCRLMLGREGDAAAGEPAQPPVVQVRDSGGPKVKIFLSHAKVDGTVPARRIRDYIYSQTQLAAFYDENDIPFGSVFERVLNRNIQDRETAALIAVRSARYASRPWCRRELSLFRRPIPESGDPQTAARWRLNPVLVVEAIEGGGRTAGIPELGNSPLIRWDGSVPEQEEEIVTTLLRDAMLAAFHSAVGRTLPEQPDRVILNWLPDPTTLLHIPRVRDPAGGEVRVVYPGRGLSALELSILEDFFPNVAFESFEWVLLP